MSLLIVSLQAQFAEASWPGTRTVNMGIARLRMIFSAARRRKLIADDPMQYVRNLRQPKSDVDSFDLNEALGVVDAAEGWERSFISVLVFTGRRPTRRWRSTGHRSTGNTV